MTLQKSAGALDLPMEPVEFRDVPQVNVGNAHHCVTAGAVYSIPKRFGE